MAPTSSNQPLDEVAIRQRVLGYLVEHGGSVQSDEGVDLEAEIAQAVGCDDVAAVRGMVRQLEDSQMVWREISGQRTLRIALGGAGGPERGERRTSEMDPRLADLRDELCHPKGHLEASILLLLDHSPGHGWELRNRLKPFGYEGEDPARVYQALHWLEEAALVESDWQTSGRGPARRVYALTSPGRQMARLCAKSMEERSRALEPHLQGDSRKGAPGATGRRRSFEVLLEAKLWVSAPDEAGARNAVERALSRARTVYDDVRATGYMHVYDVDLLSAEDEAG